MKEKHNAQDKSQDVPQQTTNSPRIRPGSLGWALFHDELLGPDPVDHRIEEPIEEKQKEKVTK